MRPSLLHHNKQTIFFMRSYRTLSRLPLKHSKRVLRTPATTRKMSLFSSPLFASNPAPTSFHPLFRLLDDFEQHSRNTEGRGQRATMKTFTPKFDVKETSENYELHGDLPGIEQKDVEIEFTDLQTITIRGRTERSYTSGTPPAGFVEGAPAQGTITEGESNNKAHKATVEDEDGVVVSGPGKSTEVATKEAPKEEPKTPEAKYWVSERSIGEFSRSFSFPVRVDQDAVKASMKNGVLTILVPKAKKHESRKIAIA